MADFHAIGGVSATLRTLLLDRMEYPDGVTAFPVTIGPPAFSSKDIDPVKEEPRLNLFLYRVTENGYLQNQEIPGRGSSSGYGHPPLSLNLHYLITAYGNAEISGTMPTLFDERTAQFLLGSAMRALHDTPIITPKLTTLRAPSGLTVLDDSLRHEFEQVKLTLEPLTLEDITKVWTALALRFRLSAGYAVNLVQIESQRPKRFPRPVGQPLSPTIPPLPTDPPSPGPAVFVFTMQTPTITSLSVRRPGDPKEYTYPYARIGDTLVIRGTALAGPKTQVDFGDVRAPVAFAANDRVEAVVPDATVNGQPIPPDRLLQPGVNTVRVVVSDPLLPLRVTTSNDAAFMLVPSIDPATLVYSATPKRSVTINGTRLIGTAPGGAAMIGRAAIERPDYIAATPTQLVVPIPDTLPMQGVTIIVSSSLGSTITIPTAQSIDITIGGVTKTVTPNLPTAPPLALADAPAVLAGLIRNAVPDNPDFTNTRVELSGNQLIVVPGGFSNAITIGPGGSALAAAFGLVGSPQPPGASYAFLSGVLASPPLLSSSLPRISILIGTGSPYVLNVPRTLSLAELAAGLQAAIVATGGGAGYAGCRVLVSGSQLLVMPGAANAVGFTNAPGDDTTVVELQLHAKFAVRVRVNGAESIDAAVLELPQ